MRKLTTEQTYVFCHVHEISSQQNKMISQYFCLFASNLYHTETELYHYADFIQKVSM